MAVILQAHTGLLELPNPEDEDIEALAATIQAHHSVTNITRVYRRSGGYRKFGMTFVLTPSQSLMTQQFLAASMGSWLLITDYRDRKYHATIITDPVEFVAIRRHRERVTFEFLGVQL